MGNFYPRSPCGERPGSVSGISSITVISIHALLAESDLFFGSHAAESRYFYPRSPCGERRLDTRQRDVVRQISIHALLAESDHQTNAGSNESGEFLSTLSLRRATCMRRCTVAGSCHFYPRSPCGERPYFIVNIVNDNYISIHALLAESDKCRHTAPATMSDFYPRSPCGERLPPSRQCAEIAKRFLSTLSLRRATPFSRSGPMTRRYFYPRSPCGERPR